MMRCLTARSGKGQPLASLTEWKVPAAVQPRPEDYGYDLDRALSSVLGLHTIIPSDAFTAETLGTERAGNGVLIDDGLVLTIGYLVTEAETVWLITADGRAVPGHTMAYDQTTGFGLVQALGRLNLPALELGDSDTLAIGQEAIVAAGGGRHHAIEAKVVGRQEFAGYWEYLIDDAIFTFPSHPNWGGTALLSQKGELIGIGSLQLEREREGRNEHLNLIVPIDLLKPVLDDLRRFGRVNKPMRPWLGIYSTEIEDKVVIVGVAPKGPAARAELKTGDVILSVDGEDVSTLAELYRKVWSLGTAGVEVPMTLYREGLTFDVRVNSSDRAKFLRAPRLH
jgi:S1-C subfamily serine protease